MIDDKPNLSSLPLLWSWGAGGVARPPDPCRPPMAKMSLILFMFSFFLVAKPLLHVLACTKLLVAGLPTH